MQNRRMSHKERQLRYIIAFLLTVLVLLSTALAIISAEYNKQMMQKMELQRRIIESECNIQDLLNVNTHLKQANNKLNYCVAQYEDACDSYSIALAESNEMVEAAIIELQNRR